MSDRAVSLRFSAFVLLGAAAVASGGCSSGGYSPSSSEARQNQPPFPTDIDPNAAYCLVWVPPTYRDVAHVVECAPGSIDCATVERQKVEFREVCTPAKCETRRTPDRCRDVGFVQVTPPHEEWREVSCGSDCSPVGGPCYRRIVVPAEYKCCPATQTEKGVEYCAYTPPERHVVAETVCVPERSVRYVPPKYEVVWTKELFQPGHYQWQRRYDCAPAQLDAPRRKCCECTCPPGSRGDFTKAPAAD